MMVDDDGVHVDEGMIHAWLDGELDAAQVARIEAHIGRCGACAARVAEARGLIAGASRVIGMLDDVPVPTVRPAVTPTAGSDLSVWRLLRVTPARASIAAALVVAIGIALTSGQLARELPRSPRVERAALPMASPPAPMAIRPTDTVLKSAIARRIAAEQPPRTVEPTPGIAVPSAPDARPSPNADLANAEPRVAAGRASMNAQREMAAPSADRTRVGMPRGALDNMVVTGTAQTAAKASDAADAAGAAASLASRGNTGREIAAGQCYRVESAGPAVWGSVRLPMVVAIDSTGAEARILTPAGGDTEARAYLQYNGADSALFRLRRIGFDGTMMLLASSGTRTGTLQSSSARAAEAPAPSRRSAMSASSAPGAGSASPAPITAQRVTCPSR